MRNKLVMTAVLGAALVTSCVKMSTDDTHRAISFVPVAEKATKAILTGTTYPTSESFKVSAYRSGQAYFENQTATYNSTLDLWATGTDQYWPLSGALTFYAFSPASAGLGLSASGAYATRYSINTAEQMVTDLLYASVTVDDCANHPASVPLTFSHALSQIVFRVKAAAYYPDISFTFNSLSISGIYSEGDFYAGSWSSQSSARQYTISSSTTALTYDAEDAPETIEIGSYLFIPQDLSAVSALNVGYTIAQTVNETTYTVENPPAPVNLRGTITQWEPGKKYIYTINIGINNVITFTASAADWNEANGAFVVE